MSVILLQLLTIMPDRANLLALAYVETDTMKFIKYTNHRAHHHGDTSYKMFSVTYCEEERDNDDNDVDDVDDDNDEEHSQ